MNIMRYTPFRDFENLLENWRFPRLPYEGADLGFVRHGEWMPSVDISESDKEFVLKVEIPEVRKDDVHVEVANGMLTIRGERREEKETTEKKLHRKELFYGRFERSFALPDNVREDAITAEQKDGMLYVRLGKAEIEKAPRKLEIKVN